MLAAQFIHRHADQPSVFLGGGFGVQLQHGAGAAVGVGHHQFAFGGFEVMGGEDLEIQPGVDHHHHGGAGNEAALVVDVGVAQVIVVPG